MVQFTAEMVNELQQAIDAKYARARAEAVKTIAEYVEVQAPPAANGQHKAPKAPKKPSPRAGTGVIRNKALAAFREGFSSIREVAEKTGLGVPQVRGVVSAPR